jgi:hypothetical protein
LTSIASLGVAGLGLLALGACDSDDVTGVITLQEYSGLFEILNGSAVAGVTDLRLDDTENLFEVSVEAGALDPGITHAQHIHAGATCPTMADDANGDGFVDVVEGLGNYGGILLPLDSDFSTQAGGEYPEADAEGVLDYLNASAYDAAIASLTPEDDDPFVELDGGFLPGTRTVVLHGVADTMALPETVQTLEGMSRQATLPVACAELERVSPLN